MVHSKHTEVLTALSELNVLSDSPVPVMVMAKALTSAGHFATAKSAANAIERNPGILIDYDDAGRRCASRRHKLSAQPLSGYFDEAGNYCFRYEDADTDLIQRVAKTLPNLTQVVAGIEQASAADREVIERVGQALIRIARTH